MDRKTLVLPAPAGLLAPVPAARGAASGVPDGGDAVRTADRFVPGGGTPPLLGRASACGGAWKAPRRTVQTPTRITRGGRPVPAAAARPELPGTRSRSDRLPTRQRGDCALHGAGRFPGLPGPDGRIAPFPDEDDVLGIPYVSTAARNQLIPESRRKADRSAAVLPSAGLRGVVADDAPVPPRRQGRQYVVAARTDADGATRTLDASSGLRLREPERGTA
ncbi:hypothetical protein AB0I99_06755 [Streptomyces spongiicola]|uniref:Uncharacterized protein n=1 Tax=Streptomyces spongiicola TaxID=1690221 RepID=A0ABN5KAX7_9ACTN|nr:hypothetical protein [Streptomyces spongiicola]AWK07856.1 hypothetical protein DDQ41_01775 [Streptomyces spongiicola]